MIVGLFLGNFIVGFILSVYGMYNSRAYKTSTLDQLTTASLVFLLGYIVLLMLVISWFKENR